MRFRARLLSTALPLALAGATPALAEVRALLVGVSDYHVLDADLKGPQNDVGLLAKALLARGADPSLITVLTTPGAALSPGIAPAADPTRAAILAALDALAAEARPGDTVIFYYSGHGAQAPDQNGDEAGGFDEILLPSDSAGWKGAIGAVENAIVDDELQLKMQAILYTGAELVAILDACHSATGFRAVGGLGEARYVSMQSLGIPEAVGGSDGGHISPPLVGDFVFLYSSQSDERSFEYPIGDKDDPRNWYGDFTRNLTAALTSVPDLTWAQALAAAADGLKQEQASQTPDGEGALDRPVFGAGGGAEGRFRVEAGRLMAGLLSGLAEGATVEIYDAAAGGASLGTARLTSVQAAEAALEFDGPLPAMAYAELRQPGRPAPLRLAPPVAADDGDYADALTRIAHIREAGLVDGLDWADADYDLRLVLVDGAIALVGRDGVLDPEGPGSSPRIRAVDGKDVILGFLDRAVRLQRLQAALSAAEGRKRGLGIAGSGLKMTAETLAAGSDDGICAEPDGSAVALKDRGPVGDCDQIWLALTNNSRTAQDVTVLYVDRDMRVVPIWPQDGLSNRVAFGETADVGLLIETAGLPGGVEQIIVIAVPARDGAPRTVLTALADPGQMREVAAGSGSATETWLLSAADPDGQSRDIGSGAGPDPVKVMRVRIVLSAE